MAYNKIILGAGLYGLYAANFLAQNNTNNKILVLEHDSTPFRRATYINQARVHMGYHYPRSFSTAIKSAHYFNRFMEDYSFCVLTKFDQVYATSADFSWTNAEQFRSFCKNAQIRCDDVNPSKFFNPGMCDGAFLTEEYTYDANILKEYFLKELSNFKTVEIQYNARIKEIKKMATYYQIIMADGTIYKTDFLLNATYASTNQITHMLGYEPFKIKYELCEIIICNVDERLKDIGITVMDGPFFSIMPFGKTGYHSLTSVTFTPHVTSYDSVPTFECQAASEGICSPRQLGNCNDCPAKPNSAWPYMSNLARKYLKSEYSFEYSHSLFSMKPILKASEIDDSRPTVIKRFSTDPTFISVLSGKINTVYDLDEVLKNGN
ncbi:FAD dependent oxidoreductase [Hungatella effluvii]|uniref:FAD dependent oxidoreductase n=1 Tax=Hungatella effluvii TaxID=1096246 RepID=A0A2V3XX53_9FIRM|nr:FAD/NAD(P)-binding protein [Hungatella effluvii]PXX48946.1 FAD dependent oxidoreductase [Hungatella effluvii]